MKLLLGEPSSSTASFMLQRRWRKDSCAERERDAGANVEIL